MASSSCQFSQHSQRSVGSCEYTSATKAFIFSLHNVHGYKPVKLAQNRYQGCVIYRCNSYGPTFGGYPTQNPSTYTVVSFQLTKNSILPVQPTLSRSLLQKFPVQRFLTARGHINLDTRPLKTSSVTLPPFQTELCRGPYRQLSSINCFRTTGRIRLRKCLQIQNNLQAQLQTAQLIS